MPPAKKKAATVEPPLAVYQEKEPTQLHINFVEWCLEQTGIECDLKTVQLAFSLRMVFQKSEYNQDDLARRREEAEQAKIDRAERAEERAAKAAEREAAKEEREAAKKAAATKKTAATAVSGGRRATSKAATAKKTTAPARRRPAAKAAAASGDGDF